MAKEVILIYQDCPDCGSSKSWYEKQAAVAKDNDIAIKKMSFIQPGAKGLIIKAASHGIQRMPFFTDDVTRPRRFSYQMEDFILKPNRKTKNLRKQAAEEIEEDGTIPEN